MFNTKGESDILVRRKPEAPQQSQEEALDNMAATLNEELNRQRLPRKATYTSSECTEVQLDFTKEYQPNHKENGQRAHLFYSIEEYRIRQHKHGLQIYPEPTKA